jgi:hypothetical protein
MGLELTFGATGRDENRDRCDVPSGPTQLRSSQRPTECALDHLLEQLRRAPAKLGQGLLGWISAWYSR